MDTGSSLASKALQALATNKKQFSALPHPNSQLSPDENTAANSSELADSQISPPMDGNPNHESEVSDFGQGRGSSFTQNRLNRLEEVNRDKPVTAIGGLRSNSRTSAKKRTTNSTVDSSTLPKQT